MSTELTLEQRKAAAADKATRVSLDRTTSGIMQGSINTPYRQLNPEQKLMLDKARLRQAWQRGEITTDQVLERAQVSSRAWEISSAQRTTREGAKAARALKSETTKQDTAREIAARQGVAIGTIQSDNSAKVSANAQVFHNQKVSQIIETNKTSIQAQRADRVKVTTPDGKERTFKNRETAEKFVKRVEGNYQIQGPSNVLHHTVNLSEGKKETFDSPYGGLEFTFQKEKGISYGYEKDNLLQNLASGLYDSLRYSDRVDTKEVEPPKGIEWLNYYASKGLSPVYNIPLSLMDDKKIQPTLTETAFDTGLQLATKGKTETHDPIGDYLRDNPIGVLSQLPAEAAMWIYGGKAVKTGGELVKAYSPLVYQSKKILTEVGAKPTTVYRGVTWKNNPVVGIQDGKIVKGYDPGKVADTISRIKVETLGREGIEFSLGSGIEKGLIYSDSTLRELVSRGIIPDVAKARAVQAGIITREGMKITSQPGEIGKLPIQDLTQKQSDVIFKGVLKGQDDKTIDLVHGSPATGVSTPEEIKTLAGSALKFGDVDVTPIGKTPKVRREVADKLIQGFAADFPLEPGQRLSIVGKGAGETTNRALKLYDPKFPEPRKIFEVVLRESGETSSKGLPSGNKILGFNIPFKKSVKAKDIPIKFHTADFQLLTNIKQVLSFQKGSTTQFDIYTSSGRTKDIVRAYWNVKGKAFFKGGEQGKLLDIEAEKFRKLYPGVKFTDYKPEKVLLSSSKTESKGVTSSSRIGKEGGSIKLGEASLTQSEIDWFDNEFKDVGFLEGLKQDIQWNYNRFERNLDDALLITRAKTKMGLIKTFDRNFAVGGDIKIATRQQVSEFSGSYGTLQGWTEVGEPRKIWLSPELRTESNLINVIHHEAMHNILAKNIGFKASSDWDNLIYADEKTPEKLLDKVNKRSDKIQEVVDEVSPVRGIEAVKRIMESPRLRQKIKQANKKIDEVFPMSDKELRGRLEYEIIPSKITSSSRTSIKPMSLTSKVIKPISSSLVSGRPSRSNIQSNTPSRILRPVESKNIPSRTSRPKVPSTPKTPFRNPILNTPSEKPPSQRPPTILTTQTPTPPKTPTPTPRILTPKLPNTQSSMILRKTKLPKPLAIIPFEFKNATKRETGKTERGHDFLGGTRVAQITGWRTTKTDITVGDKKTAKLYSQDVLKTKLGYRKSDKKTVKNLRSKTSLW